LGEALTISDCFKKHPVECGVACNLNSACTAFSLNTDTCLLFNDQISLIHLVDRTNSTVYANSELQTCIDDFYPDYTAMNCIPKKTKDVNCGFSFECSALRGLECVDVDSDSQLDSCKCQNPDANYWNNKAGKCLQLQSSGGPCESEEQCLPNKGLECANGTCQCSQLDLK
jgi:hypothetical protein